MYVGKLFLIPIYIFAILAPQITFAQKLKRIDKKNGDRISIINDYVQSVPELNLLEQQTIHNDLDSCDLYKEISKSDSSGRLVYKYLLIKSEYRTQETEWYYQDNRLVLLRFLVVKMAQKEKLDHDGMPILSFPAEETLTYFYRKKSIGKFHRSGDYSTLKQIKLKPILN